MLDDAFNDMKLSLKCWYELQQHCDEPQAAKCFMQMFNGLGLSKAFTWWLHCRYNLKGFKEHLELTLVFQLCSSTIFIQSTCHSSRALKALNQNNGLKDFVGVCVYLNLPEFGVEHVPSPQRWTPQVTACAYKWGIKLIQKNRCRCGEQWVCTCARCPRVQLCWWCLVLSTSSIDKLLAAERPVLFCTSFSVCVLDICLFYYRITPKFLVSVMS